MFIIEKTITSTSGEYSCRYNDAGIICNHKNANKDIEIFFPYGAISKIKLNFLGLTISGSNQSFFIPIAVGSEKSKYQEMVDFALFKRKNAAPASAVYVDYGAMRKSFFENYALERDFYATCKKAKLKLHPQSPQADIMRAMLIAEQKQIHIAESEIVNLYLFGKQETERIDKHQQIESLYQQAKASEKYLSYHGRQKSEIIAKKNLDYYTRVRDYILSDQAKPLQKEQDWALMGGIASGIAGGAAGLAVASDIQAKNAEIRAKNQIIRSNYTKSILQTEQDLSKEIAYWKKRYEKAKISLVDDKNPEKLFKEITITDEQAHILFDGSFVITAKATINDVVILDNVHARIDGSLTAILIQDGYVVGEAPILLPLKSDSTKINCRKCTLVGASSTRYANPNKPFAIQFNYRDLWAIEKHDYLD